jgi:hypothetical protein
MADGTNSEFLCLFKCSEWSKTNLQILRLYFLFDKEFRFNDLSGQNEPLWGCGVLTGNQGDLGNEILAGAGML